ncbi:hypothetical protein SBA5_100087 [Candidatus Sulfotelmatomonas gaucii]|uniref:Uncharacterized protein n=1 Tax=Candidatus Sulfuritelmatomonas gaucii TaxID=2043161 RepID=A0A2N9L2M8_9BACT|nr:hypothetical protein SBA5_100087 [Candidatus Sulfotelmatomonas gaucii]
MHRWRLHLDAHSVTPFARLLATAKCPIQALPGWGIGSGIRLDGTFHPAPAPCPGPVTR